MSTLGLISGNTFFTKRILVVNTWNNLPANIVNDPTQTFKRLLDEFMSCHMLLFDELLNDNCVGPILDDRLKEKFLKP